MRVRARPGAMNARLVWLLVAACGVLALGTVRAATPCRFSTAPSGTLAPFWKGRLGKRAIVMFPTIGTRGEPDQRGGGLFWAGPICTRSRRVIGNVLLRLPDQITSIASGSFLLAPNHHRQVVCVVCRAHARGAVRPGDGESDRRELRGRAAARPGSEARPEPVHAQPEGEHSPR